MDPQSTLTRLPPSPASSVLSLGSHPDHEIDEDPKRIIGVRELIKMVRGGKRDTATQSHPRKGIIIHGMPTDDGSPADISGPPPGYNEECFAKDVAITGWKVVGGSKGGEKAKVGAYVVYDIVIELQAGGKMDILRRYNDFVNLREQLKSSYPELKKVIPPLPGKAHMAKFSPKFLGDRQPRLQRFLRTVVLHPQMGAGGGNSPIYRWITSKELG